MLTAYQIEELRRRSEQLVDPITEYLIEDIAKRVAEAGQLSGTASYEVWKLQKLGVSQKKLKKELSKRLKISQQEAEKLLTQAAEAGYDFDISRFPAKQGIPLSANKSLQQVLDATVKLANDDLANITQTIGFVGPDGVCRELTDAYNQACDFAFQKVTLGAQDPTSAIRDAVKNLADKGIRTIDYASGVHTSLEAAVRRNMMGGLGLMQEKISQSIHDDLDCDGWEISAHAGSAPDHEPIQGRQYSDKAFEKLNGSLERRIGTLNCGHSAMPIIMGVNEPQYTDAELEDFRKQNEEGVTFDGKRYTLYEATQRQRKFERTIRKQKRRILVDEATGDKEKLLTDQVKLQRLKQEYTRFSKGVGLPAQHARMEAAGFSWKEVKAAEKAEKAAAKNERETLSIFKLNADYKDEYGRFDFGQACADYEKFLTSVPEKNRIYLQQSFDSVSYHEGNKRNSPFSYVAEDDEVWYDPNNRSFWGYNFIEANTHELAHRIDNFFARSSDSEEFANAINAAKDLVLRDSGKYIDYCWKHPDDPFFADIIDALSQGTADLPAGHGPKYWSGAQGEIRKRKEIFANLFSMEALSQSEDLAFFENSFPEIYKAYLKLL